MFKLNIYCVNGISENELKPIIDNDIKKNLGFIKKHTINYSLNQKDFNNVILEYSLTKLHPSYWAVKTKMGTFAYNANILSRVAEAYQNLFTQELKKKIIVTIIY